MTKISDYVKSCIEVCHLRRRCKNFLGREIKVYIKLQLVLSVRHKKVRTIILLVTDCCTNGSDSIVFANQCCKA